MTAAPCRVALMLTTPGWRGSGVSFSNIAVGLARAGHDVRLIAGAAEVAERFAATGVPVDLVPTGDTGRREVAAVRRILAGQRTQVVLADAPRDVRIARYASLARRRAIIWRYNLHGRRLATDVLQRWLFGGVSRVVHQSRYSAERLKADTPWLGHLPVDIIYNGIDVATLLPSPERGRAFRTRHGIAAHDALIVTPTSAQPEKAVSVAQGAVTRLGAARSITWLIADADPSLAAPGVRTLTPGRMSPEELHDALRAADVVLLPGAHELFGNATAEAMALECCVVAADGGATPEVVGDGGVLFAAGDAAAAAHEVAALLDDPARRAELGAAARRRIGGAFTLAAMENGYERVLRESAARVAGSRSLRQG